MNTLEYNDLYLIKVTGYLVKPHTGTVIDMSYYKAVDLQVVVNHLPYINRSINMKTGRNTR